MRRAGFRRISNPGVARVLYAIRKDGQGRSCKQVARRWLLLSATMGYGDMGLLRHGQQEQCSISSSTFLRRDREGNRGQGDTPPKITSTQAHVHTPTPGGRAPKDRLPPARPSFCRTPHAQRRPARTTRHRLRQEVARLIDQEAVEKSARDRGEEKTWEGDTT